MTLNPSAPPGDRDRTAAVAAYFENLSPASVAQLPLFYAPEVRFKDPFNEVQGLEAVTQVFEHMYASLEGPHFVITRSLVDGDQAFLTWDFKFKFKRFDTQTLQTVRGGTHLQFDAQGLIILHRDYWDAAEELYEKLPLLGGVMRWLKARAVS
jgi:ketosteroid isomerase-like protein